MLLTKVEVCNDIIEESIVEENVVDAENIEATSRRNFTRSGKCII